MRVIVSRAYFGPNQHAAGPAAYLLLALEAGDAEKVADPRWDLRRRIDAALSELDATAVDSPALEAQGDERWNPPAAVERALRQVSLAAGEPIAVIEHRPRSGEDPIELVVPCPDPELARRAGVLAVELVNALLASTDSTARDFHAQLAQLQRFAALRRPSLTEEAIVAAAVERGIPVLRFDRWPMQSDEDTAPPERRGLIQLGHGVYGMRLRGTATAMVQPQTYAQLHDREAMYRRLQRSGIAVPERNPEFGNLNSARRAVRSAQSIGYPVVLKPRTGHSGAGVSVNLSTDEAVAAAYEAASPQDRHVVVERHLTGAPYRLLVVGGEVIAACRRPSAAAVHAGESPSEVDVSELSPELQALALRAASCFGLEVAGIDLMTSDLHRPLAEVGGAVIRVDPAPDLGMHGSGKEKIPLRAAHRFLAHLFPEGRPARIPTAAITGTAGKTTTSRMVARILQETGHAVGLACSDGVYVNGELVKAGVFSGISGALQVLTDPRVEAAVLEVSRGTLAQRGLGVDRTTVSACTKVEADHLGLEGIHTLADMARLKRVVVEQATELAVLNAEDPHCLAMRPHIRARRTCLVSTDPALKPLIDHANAGGLAVVLAAVAEAPRIELWEGDQREPLLRADEIPAAWGGAARHNIQNALFASAIALGMGATRETIRRALRGFASSVADSPGRINSYDKLPFRVIIDSAGTTPGYRALCDFVDRLPAEGHRVLVFHGMGDRRDQDLRASAQRVARSFDRFICFDTDLRGRRPGDVPELFRDVLFDEGVNPERVAVCLDRQEAILRAAGQAKPGDLVVIASGDVKQLISWLDEYVDSLRDD